MSATAGILGTGLIGASIGLRARERGLRVLGADNDPGALAAALELGCIQESCAAAELYAACDLVVLAMPVRAVADELEHLDADYAGRATAILDVASVKTPVAQAARRLYNFVGTHPMAGSEGSGPRAARAALFENQTWAYVPSGDSQATGAVVEFIRLMGANPLAVEPAAHDAAVARTSHMPQIFAWIFSQRIGESADPDTRALCGPVAKELLRIGSQKPEFWDDVLHYNASNIAREVLAVASALERYIRNTP